LIGFGLLSVIVDDCWALLRAAGRSCCPMGHLLGRGGDGIAFVRKRLLDRLIPDP
jgi:hypothetical protein